MGTLKYMNLLLQLYTPSKCQIYNKWTVHEHKCLSSFLFFRFPSNWERERERVYKIWYKEKQSQGYLSYFFDGGPRRIFLLLPPNRLYAIFNTGLKKMASSCLAEFLRLLLPGVLGFGSVSYEPCPTTDFPYFLLPPTGRSPHFRFGVPATHLASTFPCQATRVRSPSINIWSPLWLIFFPNGHSLTACHC